MSGPESSFDVAASGMAAQRTQMDLIAENLANADVVRTGQPFHPRTALFESVSPFAQALDAASSGFTFASMDDFGTPFDDEGAPAGGVALAGLVESDAGDDAVTQMVGLVSSGRAYDANVAMLQAIKQMDVESIDVEKTA